MKPLTDEHIPRLSQEQSDGIRDILRRAMERNPHLRAIVRQRLGLPPLETALATLPVPPAAQKRVWTRLSSSLTGAGCELTTPAGPNNSEEAA